MNNFFSFLQVALMENENKVFRQILDSSSDPILITTRDAKIIYVNPAWEKLTGYTLEESYGKNPSFLSSGKTPKHIFKKLWKTLKKGETFMTDQVIDKRKDGTLYQINSSIYPVVVDNVQCYVQLQHDITEQKKTENMRAAFLSSVSHELKTPLTVLKLVSQMQISKAKSGKKEAISLKDLEMMHTQIDRLSNLVNDLLDSSRIETGKFSLTFEEVDLGTLLKETVKKMQIFAPTHMLELADPSPKLTVIADPHRIEQVLINLISNAIKYSPGKTKVDIAIHEEKKEVVVSVQDYGEGIAKENQQKIFDLYYQVARETRSAQEGFGLGLYLSKQIINRHKGKIWVTSELGKGSTFFFSLPLKSI